MRFSADWKPDPFPQKILYAAGAVMLFTIALAVFGRTTGIGRTALPDVAVAESRDLRFLDRPDGSVLVSEAGPAERQVEVIPAGTDHFLRTTLRGLVRVRRSEGIGSEPPFRVSRLVDGHLTLEDPATRRRIDLEAFGHSNAGAFGAILDAALRQP